MIPRQPDPASSRPELRPIVALMLALFACSLHLLFLDGLIAITGGGTRAPYGISAILAYGIAFALAIPHLSGEPAALLGFRAPRARSWLAMLLFVPAPLLVSELDNVIRARWPTPPLPEGADLPQGIAVTLELVAVFVFVVPMVSEIFFRGLLQPRLARYWGSIGALLGAASLAVVANASFVIGISSQLIGVAALPILLANALLPGLLRRSSGSVYPGMLLSMSFGVTNLLAQRELFGIPGFDLTDAPHTPLSILVLPAAMAGVGLALCRGDASLTREDIAPDEGREEPPS
jgi:membrane protease YdiL (CAAX protease family)